MLIESLKRQGYLRHFSFREGLTILQDYGMLQNGAYPFSHISRGHSAMARIDDKWTVVARNKAPTGSTVAIGPFEGHEQAREWANDKWGKWPQIDWLVMELISPDSVEDGQ